MRMRLALLALLALALAAGCGSGGGGGGSNPPDAASIVPADAQAFATIDTDGSSDQVESALAVLDKFPIKQKLTTQLEQSASKSGLHVKQLLSSVGPVLDVAVVKLQASTGAVGFARPDDEQAFVAQLKDLKHTTIDDWTVFAQSQALLDAVTNRTSSLADDSMYQAAIGSIPGTGDALARVYAPGTALKTGASLAGGTAGGSLQALTKKSVPDWITGALSSSDSDGFNLELHVKQATGGAPTGTANLADQIPADALAALSITGGSLKALPAGTEDQLGNLTQKLGIDVSSLVGILNGPVIVYVKQGTPIPEVTLAAKPPDAAGASRAIGTLMAKLVLAHGGSIRKIAVSGVELSMVNVGPVAIYWGTFNGELVVTDNPSSLATLKNGPSSKLTDDATFKAAADAAAMPSDNEAFLYVDLKDTVPMIEGLATLGGQQIPPSVDQNLAPLKTLLAYGARDGQVQTAVVNLQTN